MRADPVSSIDKRSSPTLSLCMIVKDEEYFLARCLEAVRDHVDEIIIVDTGSTDNTRSIAANFSDKIYDFEWVDDFSAARNYSLEQATGDWILVLDADELIAELDLLRIRETINNANDDAYFLIQYNYNNDPLVKDWVPVTEQSQYSAGYRGYRRNPIGRLFRAACNIHFQGAVHEIIDHSLAGLRVSTLEIPIHHHMDDNPAKRKKDRQLNYLRMISKALKHKPDGRLAASAGTVCMYFSDDYPEAVRYFRQAVDLDYDVDQNLENLAEAHYRQGQFTEARAIYLKLYKSGYASFSLYTNLANLLVRGGDYRDAIKLLEGALSLGPDDPEVVHRLEHNIRFLQGKLDAF